MEGPYPSAALTGQTQQGMTTRIAIVTTKQPGTNPRMRKNADALSAAGYDVHVLYAYNAPWADETDRAVFEKASWSHHSIGGHPQEERWTYAFASLRRKWAQWTGNLRAYFCPRLGEYVGQLIKMQPSLVIGHNPGALPILSEWSQRGPVLFDAEDDHPGEFASDAPRKPTDRKAGRSGVEQAQPHHGSQSHDW